MFAWAKAARPVLAFIGFVGLRWLLLVLESPVWSGFLPKNGLTVSITSLPFFSGVKKPDQTAMDRLRSVY
jgi:hypothetical protein